MAEGDSNNWRALCSAALKTKDPDELLAIVQELKKVLKCEEKVRRNVRANTKTNRSREEVRC